MSILQEVDAATSWARDEIVTTAGVYLPGSPTSWPLSSFGHAVEADDAEDDIDAADAVEEDYVDPSLTCHERTLDEMWGHPFARPEDRKMRDLLYGRSRAEYEAITDLEIADSEKHPYRPTARDKRRHRKEAREHKKRLREVAKTLFNPPKSFGSGCFRLPPGMTIGEWQRLTTPKPPRRLRLPTTHITRDEISRVHEAKQFANYRGVIFNVELTLSLERAGYRTPEQVNSVYEYLMERFRKFAEHRKITVIYYAVFERTENIGYHVHIHLYFPYALREEFDEWLKQTLKSYDGSPWPRGSMKRKFRNEWRTPGQKDHRFTSQHKWFRYCMKGLDPKVSREEKLKFGAEITANAIADVLQEDPGIIEFKRVRIAKAINRAAQERAEWRCQNPLFQDTRPERFDDSEYKRGDRDREIFRTSEMLSKITRL